MSLRDQIPIVIDEFNGLFDQGDISDTPPDHAIQCDNLRFQTGGFSTRNGLTITHTFANTITRVQQFTQSSAPAVIRKLVLDNTGKLYDTVVSTSVPIASNTAWADFSSVSLYDRAYITFHNRVRGIAGESLWVYDPVKTYQGVTVVTVGVGGAGYAVNDILLLSVGGGTKVKVTTVAAGVVTAVSLVSSGYGTTISTSATTNQTGIGTGCTIVIVGAGSPGARPAAGRAPIVSDSSGGPFTVVAGVAGNVEAGKHLFAVAYETDSGYITIPGPPTYFLYTAAGNTCVNFTNIPIGPLGTTKRYLLGTKVLTYPTINATNQTKFALYFLPGGTIADNVSITLNGVNFFDANLTSTADYLKDNLDPIPAGVCLSQFSSRLVIGGENTNGALVRISSQALPETISSVDGFVTVAPADGGGVKNFADYRGLLYMFKSQRTFVTRDNGLSPTLWPLDLVDSSAGAEPFCVAVVADSPSHSIGDAIVTADRSGLFLFRGKYSEIPLTWKIRNYWKRFLDTTNFSKYVLAIDPEEKLILFVFAQVDGSYKTMVGDFNDGLSPDKIKWTFWNIRDITTAHIDPVHVWVEPNFGVNPSLPSYATTNNIWKYDTASFKDNNVNLNWVYQTAKLSTDKSGSLMHTSFSKILVECSKTSGTSDIQINSYDNAGTNLGVTAINGVVRTPSLGGKYYQVHRNEISEEISFSIQNQAPGGVASDSPVQVGRLIIYAAPYSAERPL